MLVDPILHDEPKIFLQGVLGTLNPPRLKESRYNDEQCMCITAEGEPMQIQIERTLALGHAMAKLPVHPHGMQTCSSPILQIVHRGSRVDLEDRLDIRLLSSHHVLPPLLGRSESELTHQLSICCLEASSLECKALLKLPSQA